MGALRAQEAQPLRPGACDRRSEEHTSELQSPDHLVCRLLLQSHGATRALHSFPTRRSSDLGRRGLERRRNRAGNADLGPAVRGGGPAHLAGGTARVAMIRRAWARFARKKRNLFGLGLAIGDRKSTRLNSSHQIISYAVFCSNPTAPPEPSTLSLHDALPILGAVALSGAATALGTLISDLLYAAADPRISLEERRGWR